MTTETKSGRPSRRLAIARTTTQDAIIVGLIRAHRRAIADKWNRWACRECLVCAKWYKTEICIMGVCPECEDKILSLGESLTKEAK